VNGSSAEALPHLHVGLDVARRAVEVSGHLVVAEDVKADGVVRAAY